MDNQITRVERQTIVPLSRVLEDETEVIAQLEMPGVSKDGLEIKIDGPTLTIQGRRSDAIPSGKFLIRERMHDEYRKAFTIDESIDRDGISADLSEGVLTLHLKVKEAAKPRRISVG
jgi:HSP20 family protein